MLPVSNCKKQRVAPSTVDTKLTTPVAADELSEAAFGGEAVANSGSAWVRLTAQSGFTTATPPDAASFLRQLLRRVAQLLQRFRFIRNAKSPKRGFLLKRESAFQVDDLAWLAIPLGRVRQRVFAFSDVRPDFSQLHIQLNEILHTRWHFIL